MKTRTLLLLVCGSLLIGANAFGECETVITPSFQGTVCKSPSGDLTAKGKWTNDTGGTLEGIKESMSNGSRYTISKQGDQISRTFQGKLVYEEEGILDAQAKSKGILEGKQKFPDGGYFKGTNEMLRTSSPDGEGYTITQQGDLITPTFQGKRTYHEEGIFGAESISQMTLKGKQKIANSGYFDGVKEIKLVSNSSGDQYTITKQGKLITSTFQGKLAYHEEGVVAAESKSQETLEGKEKFSDGGYFNGVKEIHRVSSADVESYTITKQGELITPTFQGKLKSREEGVVGADTESKETFTGLWRNTPWFKLKGTMIIRSINGQVEVIDRRRPVPW